MAGKKRWIEGHNIDGITSICQHPLKLQAKSAGKLKFEIIPIMITV